MDDGATPYDGIVEVYDLEHADLDDDIALIRNVVQIVGDPVIEFGCGSGRVLLPVARDGYHVTGVDTSPPMLARARDLADAEGLSDRVDLLHGDMASRLPLPDNTFGVGVMALNALLHLETQEAQIAALREAHRLLDPRGQLLIDLFNPTPEYLVQLGGLHHEGHWTTASGEELDKWTFRALRPADQHLDTRIWYDRIASDGTVRRQTSTFTLRYIHPAEIELMLRFAGFAAWQMYGSWDLDPYTDGSERLLVLADLTAT